MFVWHTTNMGTNMSTKHGDGTRGRHGARGACQVANNQLTVCAALKRPAIASRARGVNSRPAASREAVRGPASKQTRHRSLPNSEAAAATARGAPCNLVAHDGAWKRGLQFQCRDSVGPGWSPEKGWLRPKGEMLGWGWWWWWDPEASRLSASAWFHGPGPLERNRSRITLVIVTFF